MPITPTFPGVYIDELPSAVRTITGVPTSVAAFVGTAPRGATDRPVRITSWADYEQEFGGLDRDSEMSHAVYQFYLNGGAEAEIVRVVRDANAPTDDDPAPDDPPLAKAATVELPGPAGPSEPVTFHAASPGAWATGNLLVRIDYETGEAPADPAERLLYNLTVRDRATGATERYLNVSTDPLSPTGLRTVIASSRLIGDVTGDDRLPAGHSPTGSDGGPARGADPFADGHGEGDGAWYTAAAGGEDGDLPVAFNYLGGQFGQRDKAGLYRLLNADIFNMLCLPGPAGQANTSAGILDAAARFCVERRAMLIVDPPAGPGGWATIEDAADGTLPLTGDAARNAAIYFPQLELPDPTRDNAVRAFPPCGVVAGVWARTDVRRGVWKAPAGTEAGLGGVRQPAVPMTDLENGLLNPRGINCLRQLPVVGNVSWGARTMRGADQLADQWKYLPVRRLALFVEESLYRGTQWVVFEPNDEPLWSSIRLNVGAFMNTLFRQGAFQGRTPREAYLVTCDSTNNPQNDIDRGIVNIQVGFAPLKPAEFVIIHIQQLAGQIQV